MNYRLSLPAAASLLVMATAAWGAQTGLYVGGSVGSSSQHYDASTFNVRSSNTGYQVAVGLRPIDLLAAEVDYVGFGRATGGVNRADTYAVGISALGFLPVPVVDLYGRLGLMDFRTDATSPNLAFHRNSANLAYGVGAGMNWGSFGARIEYTRFRVPHTSSAQLASAGLVWSFL